MEATPAPIENEEFWQRHIQMQKTSGLTRKSYSRKNGLNYNRFGYWLKKYFFKQKPGIQLLAVKIKKTSEPATQSILCTLNLNDGRCLKILFISQPHGK